MALLFTSLINYFRDLLFLPTNIRSIKDDETKNNSDIISKLEGINDKISKFDLLNIIKNVFELKNLEIVEYNNYEVDKSLVNTRNDLNIKVPGYLEMILEMREWMNKNKY